MQIQPKKSEPDVVPVFKVPSSRMSPYYPVVVPECPTEHALRASSASEETRKKVDAWNFGRQCYFLPIFLSTPSSMLSGSILVLTPILARSCSG